MRSYSVGLACLLLPSCSLLFDASPNRALDGGVADAQTNRDGPSKDGASADAQLVDSGPTPDANPGCTTRLGAVAWWRGETNADDSAGNHDGMAMTGVGYDTGKVGMAFRFNGSTGISVPDASEIFRFAGPFSVEMWVKRVATGFTPEVFVGKNQCSNSTVCLATPGSKWSFGLSDSTSYPQFLLNPVSDGDNPDIAVTRNALIPMDQQFHHLVATYTGSAMKIYVDADKAAFDIVAVSFANAGTAVPLYIGKHANGEGFNGWIDEVVYYDRALSDTEVDMLHLNDCR